MNRALMAAGLVDRVQVTLFPVITGLTGDSPIFQGAADFDLELIESRTLDGHIQSSLPAQPAYLIHSRGILLQNEILWPLLPKTSVCPVNATSHHGIDRSRWRMPAPLAAAQVRSSPRRLGAMCRRPGCLHGRVCSHIGV